MKWSTPEVSSGQTTVTNDDGVHLVIYRRKSVTIVSVQGSLAKQTDRCIDLSVRIPNSGGEITWFVCGMDGTKTFELCPGCRWEAMQYVSLIAACSDVTFQSLFYPYVQIGHVVLLMWQDLGRLVLEEQRAFQVIWAEKAQQREIPLYTK